jgi:hypothetical protein
MTQRPVCLARHWDGARRSRREPRLCGGNGSDCPQSAAAAAPDPLDGGPIGYTDLMTESAGKPATPARAQAFRVETRTQREAVLLGGALALGLLVIPLVIWIVGHRALGPYTRGDDPHGLGPLALYGDYFSGLAHGSLGYWAVAMGPALLILTARGWLALLRRVPRE